MSVFTNPVGAKPDDVCLVCQIGVPTSDNAMIYCDGKNCIVCVHQECYGVVSIPKEQKWYCKRCEPHSVVRAAKIKCVVCPEKLGAVKPTTGHEEFCHVVCALWLDGASFLDLHKMEPISLTDVAAAPASSSCYLCHEAKRPKDTCSFGRTAKCHVVGCEQHMHITCAQNSRQLLVPYHKGKLVKNPKDGFRVCCKNHKSASPAKYVPSKGSRHQLMEKQQDDGTTIRVGDHVKAFWKSSRQLYPGTITNINNDGSLVISYDDGDNDDSVPCSDVRPMMLMRHAKHTATKTIAEQAKPKKPHAIATPKTSASEAPDNTKGKDAHTSSTTTSSTSTPTPSSTTSTSSSSSSSSAVTQQQQTKPNLKRKAAMDTSSSSSSSTSSSSATTSAVFAKKPASTKVVAAKQARELARQCNTKSPETSKDSTPSRSTDAEDNDNDKHNNNTQSMVIVDKDSIDVDHTPNADILEALIKQDSHDNAETLFRYLTRSNPAIDAELPGSYLQTKEQETMLMKKVEALSAENKRLLAKLQRINVQGSSARPTLSSLLHVGVVPTDTPDETAAFRDTLISVLGISEAVNTVVDNDTLQRLDEQMKSISDNLIAVSDGSVKTGPLYVI